MTSRSPLVSSILSGSWRHSDFPRLEISEAQLDEVASLLYGSGAGALGWWRIRATDLANTTSGGMLHQAYRLLTLQSKIHEEKITKVFRVLSAGSVDAILFKGWAAAGLYPDRALRPYGDIDLLVRREQYALASSLLEGPETRDCWVDLHANLDEIRERPVADLFKRSKTIALGDATVRVLCAEDHLALLAIHLLKHGAWRPLWLCDIGATVESLAPDFDWKICLGGNQTRSEWIMGAIGLAHELLDARPDRVPAHLQAKQLPAWLTGSVLKQWEQPFAINQPPMSHVQPMSEAIRHPSMLLDALQQRWPNPILATVSVNGKFNRMPRLPYQVSNCLVRVGRFLLHTLSPDRERLSS